MDDLLNTFVDARLSAKGGADFTKINAADIRYLVRLYDEYIFDHQLSSKLEEKGMTLKYSAVSTSSSSRNQTLGELIVGNSSFTFVITPRLIPLIERKTNLSRLELIAATVQQQCIHLAMLLWNYYDRTPTTIFGPYGTLFECMMKKYFGNDAIEVQSNLQLKLNTITVSAVASATVASAATVSVSALTASTAQPKVFGAYENWENSCYIDSVLMILFQTSNDWWRRGMLESRLPSPIDQPQGICDVAGGSKIDTPDKLYKLRLKVQDALRSDYEHINNKGEIIKCSVLRNLLRECLPSLQEDGTWSLFNTAALYDLLASLFPAIALSIPTAIIDQQGTQRSTLLKRLNAIPMWDFMDPHTNIEGSYEKILWEDVESNVLVFINGALPRIKKFDEKGVEKGHVYINGSKINFQVTKARAFGETILNARYRLIGVVTLQGISPLGEGGSHYISYFLSSCDGGKECWYKYNDLTASAVRINKLPSSGVWEEKGSEMPAMYFYEKRS